LKPSESRAASKHDVVAPFTGAWIETRGRRSVITNLTVAPFTGAWIETFYGKTSQSIA